MTTVAVEFPAAFEPLLAPIGTYRWRVFYGGRGSAKSWQFARALLLHGAQRPLRILCAREYQASFKDSVHALLSDQITRMQLDGLYTVQQTSIFASNGTEFLFKGLRRDIGEIKSTEGIDVCWVEEAAAVSEESWRVLTPTIRKPGSELWVSFNPDLETDPTYKRLVVEPPSRSVVCRVGYQDNPWLPDVLRDEAREMAEKDPEGYANVWGGEPWSRSDAEVLSGKWRVAEFTPAESWGAPLFGLDYGFAADPAVCVRMWIADSRLWIDYAEGTAKMDNDQLADCVRGIPLAASHTIRADSARPETTNELRKRGLNVVSAPKWDGSVKDGVAHLRSYTEIVIHPRAQRAIREARLWRYKTDPRTNDILPVLVDANNHVWDAARYGLAPMIRQTSRPRMSTA